MQDKRHLRNIITMINAIYGHCSDFIRTAQLLIFDMIRKTSDGIKNLPVIVRIANCVVKRRRKKNILIN